jgi:hypothetical protein
MTFIISAISLGGGATLGPEAALVKFTFIFIFLGILNNNNNL